MSYSNKYSDRGGMESGWKDYFGLSKTPYRTKEEEEAAAAATATLPVADEPGTGLPAPQSIGVEGYTPQPIQPMLVQLPQGVLERMREVAGGRMDNTLMNLVAAHYKVFGTWPDFSLTADILDNGEVEFSSVEEAVSFFQSVRSSYTGTGREWMLDASGNVAPGEKAIGSDQRRARMAGIWSPETDVLDPEMIASFRPKKVEDFLFGPYMKRSVKGKNAMFRDGAIRLDEMLVALPRQWAISQLGQSLTRQGRMNNPDLGEDEALMTELNKFLASRVPKEYAPAPTAAWQQQTEDSLRLLQQERAAALYVASADKGEAKGESAIQAAAFLESQGHGDLLTTLDQEIRQAAMPSGSTPDEQRKAHDAQAKWVTQMWVASRNPGITERMALNQLYHINSNALPLDLQKQMGSDQMMGRFGMLVGWLDDVPVLGEAVTHVVEPGLKDLMGWIPGAAGEINDAMGGAPGAVFGAVGKFYEYRNLLQATAHQMEQDIDLPMLYVNPESVPASQARQQAFAEYLTLQNREHPDAEKTGSFIERWKFYWHNNQDASEAGIPMQYTDELMRDTGHDPAQNPELSFLIGFIWDTILDVAIFRGATLPAKIPLAMSSAGKIAGVGKTAASVAVKAGEEAARASGTSADLVRLSTTGRELGRVVSETRLAQSMIWRHTTTKVLAGSWKRSRFILQQADESPFSPAAGAARRTTEHYSGREFQMQAQSLFGISVEDSSALTQGLLRGEKVHRTADGELLFFKARNGGRFSSEEIIEDAVERFSTTGKRKLSPSQPALWERAKDKMLYDQSSKLYVKKHPYVTMMLEKSYPVRKVSLRNDHAFQASERMASQTRTTINQHGSEGFSDLVHDLQAKAAAEENWDDYRALMSIAESGDKERLANFVGGKYAGAMHDVEALMWREGERDLQRALRKAESEGADEAQLAEIRNESRLAERSKMLHAAAVRRGEIAESIDATNGRMLIKRPASRRFSEWLRKKDPQGYQQWLDYVRDQSISRGWVDEKGDYLVHVPKEAERRKWMEMQLAPGDRIPVGIVDIAQQVAQDVENAVLSVDVSTGRNPNAIFGVRNTPRGDYAGGQIRWSKNLEDAEEISKAMHMGTGDRTRVLVGEQNRYKNILHMGGYLTPEEEALARADVKSRIKAINTLRERARKAGAKASEITEDDVFREVVEEQVAELEKQVRGRAKESIDPTEYRTRGQRKKAAEKLAEAQVARIRTWRDQVLTVQEHVRQNMGANLSHRENLSGVVDEIDVALAAREAEMEAAQRFLNMRVTPSGVPWTSTQLEELGRMAEADLLDAERALADLFAPIYRDLPDVPVPPPLAGMEDAADVTAAMGREMAQPPRDNVPSHVAMPSKGESKGEVLASLLEQQRSMEAAQQIPTNELIVSVMEELAAKTGVPITKAIMPEHLAALLLSPEADEVFARLGAPALENLRASVRTAIDRQIMANQNRHYIDLAVDGETWFKAFYGDLDLPHIEMRTVQGSPVGTPRPAGRGLAHELGSEEVLRPLEVEQEQIFAELKELHARSLTRKGEPRKRPIAADTARRAELEARLEEIEGLRNEVAANAASGDARYLALVMDETTRYRIEEMLQQARDIRASGEAMPEAEELEQLPGSGRKRAAAILTKEQREVAAGKKQSEAIALFTDWFEGKLVSRIQRTKVGDRDPEGNWGFIAHEGDRPLTAEEHRLALQELDAEYQSVISERDQIFHEAGLRAQMPAEVRETTRRQPSKAVKHGQKAQEPLAFEESGKRQVGRTRHMREEEVAVAFWDSEGVAGQLRMDLGIDQRRATALLSSPYYEAEIERLQEIARQLDTFAVRRKAIDMRAGTEEWPLREVNGHSPKGTIDFEDNLWTAAQRDQYAHEGTAARERSAYQLSNRDEHFIDAIMGPDGLMDQMWAAHLQGKPFYLDVPGDDLFGSLYGEVLAKFLRNNAGLRATHAVRREALRRRQARELEAFAAAEKAAAQPRMVPVEAAKPLRRVSATPPGKQGEVIRIGNKHYRIESSSRIVPGRVRPASAAASAEAPLSYDEFTVQVQRRAKRPAQLRQQRATLLHERNNITRKPDAAISTKAQRRIKRVTGTKPVPQYARLTPEERGRVAEINAALRRIDKELAGFGEKTAAQIIDEQMTTHLLRGLPKAMEAKVRKLQAAGDAKKLHALLRKIYEAKTGKWNIVGGRFERVGHFETYLREVAPEELTVAQRSRVRFRSGNVSGKYGTPLATGEVAIGAGSPYHLLAPGKLQWSAKLGDAEGDFSRVTTAYSAKLDSLLSNPNSPASHQYAALVAAVQDGSVTGLRFPKNTKDGDAFMDVLAQRIEDTLAGQEPKVAVRPDAEDIEVISEVRPSNTGTRNIYWGTGENPTLSNLAPRPFKYQNRNYVSVEHAYQTLKSGKFDEKVYNDPRWQRPSPGKAVRGSNTMPNAQADMLMESLIYFSFKENSEALKELLATGTDVLTHRQGGAWAERFPRALMRVRERLRPREAQTPAPVPAAAPTVPAQVVSATGAGVLHSGGAMGADDLFGRAFAAAGYEVRHYHAEGAPTPRAGAHGVPIPLAELEAAREPVQRAAVILHKSPPTKAATKQLIYRNWWQVKDADQLIAVLYENPVKGMQTSGTGWAIAMAQERGIPIFVLDQSTGIWWSYTPRGWVKSARPVPTKNFAGIGTRKANEVAEREIAALAGEAPQVTPVAQPSSVVDASQFTGTPSPSGYRDLTGKPVVIGKGEPGENVVDASQFLGGEEGEQFMGPGFVAAQRRVQEVDAAKRVHFEWDWEKGYRYASDAQRAAERKVGGYQTPAGVVTPLRPPRGRYRLLDRELRELVPGAEIVGSLDDAVMTNADGLPYVRIKLKNGMELDLEIVEDVGEAAVGARMPWRAGQYMPRVRVTAANGNVVTPDGIIMLAKRGTQGHPVTEVAAHELFHAVQWLGLLTEKEWKALERIFPTTKRPASFSRVGGPAFDYTYGTTIEKSARSFMAWNGVDEVGEATSIFAKIRDFFRGVLHFITNNEDFMRERAYRRVERTFTDVKTGRIWERTARDTGAAGRRIGDLEKRALYGEQKAKGAGFADEHNIDPEQFLGDEAEEMIPEDDYPFTTSFEEGDAVDTDLIVDDFAIDHNMATPEQVRAEAPASLDEEVASTTERVGQIRGEVEDLQSQREALLAEQARATADAAILQAELDNIQRLTTRGLFREPTQEELDDFMTLCEELGAGTGSKNARAKSLKEKIDSYQKIIDAIERNPEHLVEMFPEPLQEWQLKQWHYSAYNYSKLSKFLAGGPVKAMEKFNSYKWMFGAWSIDDATTLYKTIVMAKISTMLRIPLADEFTRFITEGINPLEAWKDSRMLRNFDQLPEDIQFKVSELIRQTSEGTYSYIGYNAKDSFVHYMHKARATRRDPTFARFIYGRRLMETGRKEKMLGEVRDFLKSDAKEKNLQAIVANYLKEWNGVEARDGSLFKAWFALGMQKDKGLRTTAWGSHRMVSYEGDVTRQRDLDALFETEHATGGKAIPIDELNAQRAQQKLHAKRGLKGDAQGLVDGLVEDLSYWYDHPLLGHHFRPSAEQAVKGQSWDVWEPLLERGIVPKKMLFGEIDEKSWKAIGDIREGKSFTGWDGTTTYTPDAMTSKKWVPIVFGQRTFDGTNPTVLHKGRDILYSVLDFAGAKMNESVYAHAFTRHRIANLREAKAEILRREGKLRELTVAEELRAEEAAHFTARQYMERVMFTNMTYGGEDFLRNLIMFLPAYRQFAQYWLPYLAKHPVATGAVYRLNQHKEDLTVPVGNYQLDFSRMSFLINQSDPENGGSYTGWLPNGAPLITFPVSTMAHLSRNKQGNVWGQMTGKWPFDFSGEWSALHSPLDKIVYGATGYTLPWPFGTDPSKNAWRAIQIQREELINHDKKISGGEAMWRVRMNRLQEGLWNFVSPVSAQVINDDVEAMVQGKVDYQKAKNAGDVAKILSRKEMSIFKTYLIYESLPSNEQMRYISQHPEIVPYAVSGYTTGTNTNGSVGLLWSQMKASGVPDPQAYVQRVDAKYDQINKVHGAERLRGERDAEELWWRNIKAARDTHDVQRLDNEFETSTGAFGPNGVYYMQGKRGMAWYKTELNRKYAGISDPYTGIGSGVNYDSDAYLLAKFMDQMGGAGRALLQLSPNYEMYVTNKYQEQQARVTEIVKGYTERRMSTRFTPADIREAGYSGEEADDIHEAIVSIDNLWDAADKVSKNYGGYATSEGRAVRKKALEAQNGLIHSSPLMEEFLGNNIGGMYANTYLTKPAWERTDFVRIDKMDAAEREVFAHLLAEKDPETGKPRLSLPYLPDSSKIAETATILGYVPDGKRWLAKVSLGNIVGTVPVKAPAGSGTVRLAWRQTEQLLASSFEQAPKSEAAMKVWREKLATMPTWAQTLVEEDIRASAWQSWLEVAGRARAELRDTPNEYYSDAPGYSLVSTFGKQWKQRLIDYAATLSIMSPVFAEEWQTYNKNNEMLNSILGWYL